MTYYNWTDHELTPDEHSARNLEDPKDLHRKGHLLSRLAHAKTLVNESNATCRRLLAQFGDTPPHMLNFLTRAQGINFRQSTIDALNARIIPGLKCVYFEDNPLYQEYFDATALLVERESALGLHKKKYKAFTQGQNAKDAKRRGKQTLIT